MIAVIDIVALLQNNQLVRRKYYKMKWKTLLDMLLKDWDIDKTDVPNDLSKEDAIQYVKRLKDSGTERGEAFVLWSYD